MECFLHSAFLVIIPLSSLPQSCSVAVCQRIQCDIQSFSSQEEFNVTLKGNLSFDWYIKVCGALRLSQSRRDTAGCTWL